MVNSLCFADMRGSYLQGLAEAEQYINFLHQLSDMGAAMRDVITDAITDAEAYNELARCKAKNPSSSLLVVANLTTSPRSSVIHSGDSLVLHFTLKIKIPS